MVNAITEKCKEHFEKYLRNIGFQCDTLQYPNLIFIRNGNVLQVVQVVCPDRINPRWLAVNANRRQADFCVGYIRNENGAKLVGFAYHGDFMYYPEYPDQGWRNPTYRVTIESLRNIYMLFEVLKSPVHNYV